MGWLYISPTPFPYYHMPVVVESNLGSSGTSLKGPTECGRQVLLSLSCLTVAILIRFEVRVREVN